jgi:hypothetical protein
MGHWLLVRRQVEPAEGKTVRGWRSTASPPLSSLTRNNEVMSRTVWPWPNIITTSARRNRIGFFMLRVILCSLRPSSMDNGRTDTLGLRATPPPTLDVRAE